MSPRAQVGMPIRQAPRPPQSGSGLKIAIIVIGALVLAAVAVVLTIPQLVKRRCIAAAAAEGVTLTIGGASVAWGEVHLTDVGFTIDGVPQIRGEATDVQVSLYILTPTVVAGQNVGITIDGPAEEVEAALEKWRASHAKPASSSAGAAAATTAEEMKIAMVSGHLTWTRAFGMVGKIDASEVTASTDGAGVSFHLVGEKTKVGTPRGDLGPWRLTFERDAQSTRTRIDFDPVVRDGPSAFYVKTPSGGYSLKVGIAKSALPNLGIPAAVLGLSGGQTTSLDAQIDLERPTPQRMDLKAQIGLTGARLGAAPLPVDGRLEFAAAGDPSKPVNVSKGSLVLGPFQASVTGTVQLFDDGARVALAWKAQALKCEKIAQDAAKNALGDLGAQLGAFAQQLGVAKVTGDANLSGLVTLDTRNLNDASVTVTSKDTCGIAILP